MSLCRYAFIVINNISSYTIISDAMDLRKKPRLDYKQMNDGEIADRKEIIKKRKVLPALYDVERIISVKNGSKEGPLYLVKWQGYGFDECTWEPIQHLPKEVIEEFNKPTVTEESIDFYSKLLEEGTRKRLNSRNGVFSVTFPSELYRFVFGTTGEILAMKDDFGKLNLREHWDQIFRNNGVGIGLKFPVRISHAIRNKDDFVPVNGVLKKQRNLVERLRITSSTGVVFCSLN